MTNLIEQMNDRNAVLSDLSKEMAEARRLAEIASHRYYAVYQGACYQCGGEGAIDRDFGAPLVCPVCNGTKRWPPEEVGE